MNKEDTCELHVASLTAHNLNHKIFLLQAQLDDQTGELKQTKEECQAGLENEKALMNEIEKIKEMVIEDVEGPLSLEKLTTLIHEILAKFKSQIQ